MPTVPRQQTFDTVVLALRRQARPSVDVTRGGFTVICRYRSNDGCKCAVGHLIPDDRYHRELEGNVIDEDEPSTPVTMLIASLGHDLALAKELQVAHDLLQGDLNYWLPLFLQRCKDIAVRFGLDDAAVCAPPAPHEAR